MGEKAKLQKHYWKHYPCRLSEGHLINREGQIQDLLQNRCQKFTLVQSRVTISQAFHEGPKVRDL